jgi:DNA repair exonuclease SbcCD ATPase subunit
VRVYIPPPIEETQKLADAGELVEGTTPQEDLVILTDEEIEPEQDVETPDDTGLETEEAYEPADTASVEESPRKGKFPALSAEKKGIQKRPGTAVEKERPPESLPVLTAFQQFLDRERRRMRARIFVLIMFFSAIMLLTVAGLLFAARTFQARIQDDLDRLQTDINSVGNSGQSALSQLQAEASDLRKELDMEKNARKNLSGNRTEIESKINAYAKRLEKLTATTELLQAENAILQTKLGKLKDQVRIAATSPGNAVGRRSGSTMTLSVLPRGGKHARQWRVPIPE